MLESSESMFESDESLQCEDYVVLHLEMSPQLFFVEVKDTAESYLRARQRRSRLV